MPSKFGGVPVEETGSKFGGIAVQTPGFSTEAATSIVENVLGIDKTVDQSGIQDFGLRADVSRGDTRAERRMLLERAVGPDGIAEDKFGNLVVTPAGAAKLGIETQRPIRFDEPTLSFSDIADLRGDAPAILGSAGGGLMASGLGMIPGMLAVGAGGALGKAIDEGADWYRRDNLQSAGEVATDIATAGAEGAVGEGVFRGILAPLGRKILAPNQSATGLSEGNVMPGALELRDQMQEIGAVPQLSNLIDRPILNRINGVIDTIFGDLNAQQNSGAFNREIRSLREQFNSTIDNAVDLGEAIKSDIVGARKTFGEQARAKFALVDTILKGRPIVQPTNTKQLAAEILETFPKDKDGKVIMTAAEELSDVTGLNNLPDMITVEQMQALRTKLFDRLEEGLTPGVASRDAARLIKALNKDLDETIGGLPALADDTSEIVLTRQALEQLKQARTFYKDGIGKFENAMVKRIAKDEAYAGSLAPERVADLIFKKDSVTPIRKILEVVGDKREQDIKSYAMSKILDEASTISTDPLKDKIFDGTALLKTIDSYGAAVKEMFGEEGAARLQRLGKAMQGATRNKGKTNGSLVAAAIAVNPLQNLSKLVKFRILGQVFSTPKGQKWLLEGFEAKTAREATAAFTRLNIMMNQYHDEYSLGSGMSNLINSVNEESAPQN